MLHFVVGCLCPWQFQVNETALLTVAMKVQNGYFAPGHNDLQNIAEPLHTKETFALTPALVYGWLPAEKGKIRAPLVVLLFL